MKKIIFRPISTEAQKMVAKPKPAIHYVPEWYKKIPKFDNNEFKVLNGGRFNTTMKKCLPFMDTFMTGYIQETWTDIYVEIDKNNNITYNYSSGPPIIKLRDNKNYYPQINKFNENELAWQQVWIPQLPNGYSMLYTHPLNRYDLPFLSLTGIIDNDKYYMESLANHPFFIERDFNGLIPAGTPMFQMIPIKRDRWRSYFKNYDQDLQIKFLEVRKFFMDGYKKLYWQKKEYS
jgi:hypothetical protein